MRGAMDGGGRGVVEFECGIGLYGRQTEGEEQEMGSKVRLVMVGQKFSVQ